MDSHEILTVLSDYIGLEFGSMQSVSKDVKEGLGRAKDTYLFVKRLDTLSKRDGAMRTRVPNISELLNPQDEDDVLSRDAASTCLTCPFSLSEELEMAVDLERRCTFSSLVRGTKDPNWRAHLCNRVKTGCDLPVAWILAFANASLATNLSFHISKHHRHELDGLGFNPPHGPGISYMFTKFWSKTNNRAPEEQFCSFERLIDRYYKFFPPLKINGCWFCNHIFSNKFDLFSDDSDSDDDSPFVDWNHPAWEIDGASVGNAPPLHVSVFGSLIMMVACAGHTEILKHMLKAGATVSAFWSAPFWSNPKNRIYPVALSFEHLPEEAHDAFPQFMHWEAVGEAMHLFTKHAPRNKKEEYHLMIGCKRLSGIRASWAYMVSIEGVNQGFVSFLLTEEFRGEIEAETAADWLLLHADDHVPDLNERSALPPEYD
jgi:hypothetical protein